MFSMLQGDLLTMTWPFSIEQCVYIYIYLFRWLQEWKTPPLLHVPSSRTGASLPTHSLCTSACSKYTLNCVWVFTSFHVHKPTAIGARVRQLEQKAPLLSITVFSVWCSILICWKKQVLMSTLNNTQHCALLFREKSNGNFICIFICTQSIYIN